MSPRGEECCVSVDIREQRAKLPAARPPLNTGHLSSLLYWELNLPEHLSTLLHWELNFQPVNFVDTPHHGALRI